MRKNAARKVRHIKRHFRRADPVFSAVVAGMDIEPLRGERDPSRYFPKLCREILSQQLSGKAAGAIVERFLKLFPSKHPTPARVLALPEKTLRDVGMSWAKARYVRDLALKTRTRAIRLQKLPTLGDEDVIAELTKVKGVGRWTAEMFLIFTLGREDVFSHGDLGLRKGMERVYGARRAKTQTHREAIAKRWSPYRSYASLALWHRLDSDKLSSLIRSNGRIRARQR